MGCDSMYCRREVLAHGQPDRTQEAASEFGIGICCRFGQDLHSIIVYTELYLTILHCAILHYTALYNGIYGHEYTEFMVGWQKRLWEWPYPLLLQPEQISFFPPASLISIHYNSFLTYKNKSQSIQIPPVVQPVPTARSLLVLCQTYGPAIGMRVAVCNTEVTVYLPHEWHRMSSSPDITSCTPLRYTLVLTDCMNWQSF